MRTEKEIRKEIIETISKEVEKEVNRYSTPLGLMPKEPLRWNTIGDAHIQGFKEGLKVWFKVLENLKKILEEE